MKMKAVLLSILFIFATVFANAKISMGQNMDCCKTSHCGTKTNKKGCNQKDNCANFCCLSITAIHAPQTSISQKEKVQDFQNKIFFKNENKINNNGLPFFHPPSQF